MADPLCTATVEPNQQRIRIQYYDGSKTAIINLDTSILIALGTSDAARNLIPRVIQVCVDGTTKSMIIIAGEPY